MSASDPDRTKEPAAEDAARTVPLVEEPLPRIPGVALVGRIGKGGMGVVWRGKQEKLGRAVAIKTLGTEYRGGAIERRFLAECQNLARLQHPNVVTCHDSGVSSDGVPYMLMELVEGSNLLDWVRDHGPLAPEIALSVVIDLARALEHGLEHRLVHRDVKPENVLLKPDRQARSKSFPFTVKLADFGLSRCDEPTESAARITMPGEAWGSPLSMAPEQFEAFGEVDFRCDVYALGCVLYYLVTGEQAFEAQTIAEIKAKKRSGTLPDAHARRAEVSTETAALIRRMIAADPAARPESYEALVARLLELVQIERANAQARAGGTQGSTTTRKRVAAIAGGVLVLGVVAFVLARGAKKDAPSNPPSPDPPVGPIDHGGKGSSETGEHHDAPDPAPVDASGLAVEAPRGVVMPYDSVEIAAVADGAGFDAKYEWRIEDWTSLDEVARATAGPRLVLVPQSRGDRAGYEVAGSVVATVGGKRRGPARFRFQVGDAHDAEPLAAGSTAISLLPEDASEFARMWHLDRTQAPMSDGAVVSFPPGTTRQTWKRLVPAGDWQIDGKLSFERAAGIKSPASCEITVRWNDGRISRCAWNAEAGSDDTTLALAPLPSADVQPLTNRVTGGVKSVLELTLDYRFDTKAQKRVLDLRWKADGAPGKDFSLGSTDSGAVPAALQIDFTGAVMLDSWTIGLPHE